jgi:hypothetical protein
MEIYIKSAHRNSNDGSTWEGPSPVIKSKILEDSNLAGISLLFFALWIIKLEIQNNITNK